MLSRIFKISTLFFIIQISSVTAIPLAQNLNSHRTSVNQIESILVFISLNMPDKILQKLSQDTQKSHIPTHLILKRLYKNSLDHTQQRIKKLGIQVMVHPELFEENIAQNMPTFIFNRKVGLLILHGNLSLESATAEATHHPTHKS